MSRQNGAKKWWIRYLVVFFLGAWGGGAAFLLYFGHQLETVLLANHNLQLQNEKLKEEVEQLKHTENVARSKRELVIEEVLISVLEPKPDAFTEAEVIRRMEKDLTPLKGKKVDQVADIHPILHEMLKRREYVIDGKTAEVRLKTVVISRVLQLYVTVVEKNGGIGTWRETLLPRKSYDDTDE